MKNVLALSVSFSIALTGALCGQTPAGKVTYNDHVLPIFRNACLNCHNPDKKKAGLDLSTYQGALQGSETGKVLQSGNPNGSLLFKCVKQTEEPKMPPKGDRLTDAELAVLEKWIAGQLLETATGKAVAASNNNVQVATVSLERPAGPPPMPGDLPLEPFVHTKRKNALVALAASPWAPLVAVGGQKQIILYHTENLEPLGVLPFPEGFPAIIRFSRNGQLLLTGGGHGGKSGKVVLWEIKTGERVATLGNEFDQVIAADLSADHQYVALGGPNKLVKIYATKDGKLLHSMKKHTDWVTAIAYSPDGKFLASADRNGGIQVWEGSSGKEFNSLPGHKTMVSSLAFLTGVIASASEDGTVKLWDVKEGKEMKSWNAHSGGVAWVDFTPDGRLVSCGRDKIAKIWDQTGKELGKTAEPFGDIALRAVLNSERIIAGDWTGEIRVCSIDGKRVGELSANPPAIAERLELAQKALRDAEAELPLLQQQIVAAEEKAKAERSALEEKSKVAKGEPAAEPSVAAETERKVAALQAELSKLRQLRGAQKEGSAEYAEANAKVQAKKAEIEEMQKGLVVRAEPPAPKPTAAEQQLAELKTKLDQTAAQITRVKAAVEKWTRAKAFMTVYTAKQTFAEKRAQYEELLAAVKEAMQPAEKVQADFGLAVTAAADAPAQTKMRETLLAQATETAEALSKGVGVSESALAAKEAESKGSLEAFDKATATAADLGKKLEVKNAEVTKLREARAKQISGTEEYAAADAKVQAKKAEIAQTQSEVQSAQSKAAELKSAVEPLRSEIAKAREALEKARADAQAANAKVVETEKAVAEARKNAATAEATLAKLRSDLPAIVQKAENARQKAEQESASLSKELDGLKSHVERVQADYQSRWPRPAESASAAPAAPSKS